MTRRMEPMEALGVLAVYADSELVQEALVTLSRAIDRGEAIEQRARDMSTNENLRPEYGTAARIILGESP